MTDPIRELRNIVQETQDLPDNEKMILRMQETIEQLRKNPNMEVVLATTDGETPECESMMLNVSAHFLASLADRIVHMDDSIPQIMAIAEIRRRFGFE